MSLHRVFVYGTLKKGEPNHHLLTDPDNGRAKFVGHAKTIQSWPLVIASKYNIPFLLFCEGQGYPVAGEVYDVDDAMLAVLDELESHPMFYERVKYDVTMRTHDSGGSNETTNCWIYFLKKYKYEMLDLPYMEDYSSYGEHGLQYVTRYNRPALGPYHLEAAVIDDSH